jgi:Tfp pilus assembly protein PilN
MRSIEINILPQELRAKPLIDAKTFALIALAVLLAFGCVYFIMAKSSVQSEIADLEDSIAAMQQQTTALSTNPEAQSLINSISQLKTSQQHHAAFVASKVLWGDAMEAVYGLVPRGLRVESMVQKGNGLEIKGVASSYSEVSEFGRALNNDSRFTLAGLPAFKEGGFTVTVNAKAGGGS